MVVKARKGRTVLGDFRQSGSLKCLFPRLPRGAFETVLVNTAGGVTGGDHFNLSALARPDTALTLTTQACERAYRAQPGQTGTVRTHLRVGPQARINWLPQETILFNGSALDRKLTVELAQGASFLMVEPMIFGRAAMGETLAQAHLNDRVDIRREGVPLYLDVTRLHGDVAQQLARPATGNGAGAMASVVLVSDLAEARLDEVRNLLPDTAGASLLRPDVMVLRLLAQDGFALRKTLVPALSLLNGAPLPRCWMI
ncbi:urease accessory protein UreD [Shimia sp. SDUM112013]|uniref:urease accessory protein UreD n=1 Tax=Shimia sp. SDUM112013 TaxID=3136160 RepID=UPI0032EF966B